ncbi:hypothetical protein [Pseudomonas sp. sia0905]|uniref:hypothetical protein n=1 Tax=Pseudomonas sp. sia0905 TaxID=2854783 RepID=UPI001C44F8AF|nr:hypothetical protein [Pseudomonas sp. sia0905]MBV7562871.1 hypothetical protein [Pseudomonas sp. sia0905]
MTRLSKRQARRAVHARNRAQWQMPQPSRRAAWAARLLLPLTAMVMFISAAAILFTVGQALYSGVAISLSRIGPSTLYPLASDPLGYWLTLLWHSVVALFFVGLGGLSWWISRQR